MFSKKEKAAEKIQEAQALLRAERIEEALQRLYEASELDPQNAEAFVFIGNIEQLRENVLRAVNAFRQAIALDPNQIEAYGRMAACLVDLNQFDEAQGAIQKAVAIFQEQNKPVPPSYAAVARGVSILKARYDAETEFQQNPQTVQKLTDLPHLVTKMQELQTTFSQDPAGTLNNLEAVLKDYANVPELFVWHGTVMKALGYAEWAMRDFTRAICLDPRYTLAYIERCAIWSGIGRFAEIFSDTEKILAYDADNIEVIALRTDAYALKGDKLGAMRESEAFLKFDLSQYPNPVTVLRQGDTFFQNNRLDEALRVYEKLLARPNLPLDLVAQAHYSYSKLLLRMGRGNEAVDSAIKAVELNPNNADYCHILGETGKQAGRWKDSVRGWQAYISAVKAGAQGFLPVYVAENFLREAQGKA